MGKMYGQLPDGAWLPIKITADGGLIVDTEGTGSSDSEATIAYYGDSLATLTNIQNRIPATIGQKPMATSFAVTVASDQVLSVAQVSNITVVTRTSVAAAAVSTVLLAALATRKGASFFNDSTVDLYLAVGSTPASLTDYTIKIAPGGFYELIPTWATFEIRGIWAASPTGSVRITAVS